MSNVVGLRDGEQIWVCDCDCSTFELLRSGHARCAHCGKISNGDGGGWYVEIADGPLLPDRSRSPFRDVQGNGSEIFARLRVAQIAAGDDVVGLVAVRGDGSVHAWCDAERKDRGEWVIDRIKEAFGLIRGCLS